MWEQSELKDELHSRKIKAKVSQVNPQLSTSTGFKAPIPVKATVEVSNTEIKDFYSILIMYD